jgi:hypothetical protein
MGARLRPGATLEIDITAPDDVGKVLIFKILSGRQPLTVAQCLPPGAHRPATCFEA